MLKRAGSVHRRLGYDGGLQPKIQHFIIVVSVFLVETMELQFPAIKTLRERIKFSFDTGSSGS